MQKKPTTARKGVVSRDPGAKTKLQPGTFQWPLTLASALQAELPQKALKQCLLTSEFTCSSHFSGMGTSEVALAILKDILKKKAGLDVNYTVTSACDVDPLCIRMLKAKARDYHPSKRIAVVDLAASAG